MKIYYLYLIVLLILFQSCSNSKLVAENEQLKLRIADLEHRIYTLTESPDQLAKDVIQDVNLLMTIPYFDNIEMAKSLIQTFKNSYPENKYIPELEEVEKELERKLKKLNRQNTSDNKKINFKQSDIKLQFSVNISEKSQGFTNVKLSIQNLSTNSLNNIWVKGTLIDKKGESYGLTQDFFYNQLEPYELKSETLIWEYIQLDNVSGILLRQVRYSNNRKTEKLQKHESIIGQGNVKIFLDF